MEGTQQGNSGVFSSVAEAVAELDRRDAQNKPEEATQEEDIEAESGEETRVQNSDEESDDDSQEVEPDEGESEEAEPVSVEFDGKTLEIPKGTPPELVQAVQKLGNDLKADYTRKTQAVAEERKVIESAKQQAMAQATQLKAVQQTLVQMAQEIVGAEPDLSLAQTDPQAYLVQKGMYEKRVALFNQLYAQGQQLQEQTKQEQEKAQAEYRAREAEAMLKAMPELAKPEKFQKFRETVIEVGNKYGFKPEELSAISDHRMVLALRDLAAFHKGKEAAGEIKDKLKNVPPKVAKPGTTAPGDNAARRAMEAKQRFLKSGRTDRDLRRWAQETS